MHKQHPQTAYRKYAVSLHDPSREKVNRENPQIFPIYKLQIIFPLMMRKANAARIQIVLHRTKNSGAVRRKGGFAGKNAAWAAPQAGGGAVAQQLPLPGGQSNGAGGFGGIIKDAQGAPCRAVAPDGGQHPAHQRLFQRKELQSLRGVTVGAA